jgi:hypothetical protein
MAKALTDAECKNILLQAKQWDENSGTTVFKDFVNIVHNSLADTTKVDFAKYGYKEFTMFGECLSLFNDRGYDQVTKLIDIVLDFVEYN